MITRRQTLKGMTSVIATPLVSKVFAQSPMARIRRDVTVMANNDPFFTQYAEAVQRMHALPASDPRNWRNQAIIHADHCPHGMADFLPWHRFYITCFEEICGQLIGDPGFALPYWNWSNNDGLIPGPFFDENPLNVTFLNDASNYRPPGNARSNWGGRISTVGRRSLTRTRGLGYNPRFAETFSRRTIDEIKGLKSFNTFYRRLEVSPHNVAHILTGGGGNDKGHMFSGLSPLDPIFWLHHCNVDRIWAEWQRSGNRTPSNTRRYDGEFYDASGQPVNVMANGARDHVAMGFTYDTISKPVSPLPIAPGNPEFSSESFDETDAASLGVLDNNEKSIVDAATHLRVNTPGLMESLFPSMGLVGSLMSEAAQIWNDPRETSRILAVLKGVSYPEAGKDDVIVNVFVDCPYISPELPGTDPHYAGTFAFFGQLMKEERKDGGEFIIDVSTPLRTLVVQGRLDPAKINVQLMPVTVTEDGPKDATFTVSSVEIIRV